MFHFEGILIKPFERKGTGNNNKYKYQAQIQYVLKSDECSAHEKKRRRRNKRSDIFHTFDVSSI